MEILCFCMNLFIHAEPNRKYFKVSLMRTIY